MFSTSAEDGYTLACFFLLHHTTLDQNEKKKKLGIDFLSFIDQTQPDSM
jgi:hypothetical protein